MTHESGSTYKATIGSFSQAGTLYYYVKAQDNAGNEAQSSTYTITVNDCDTIPPSISNIRESADPINKQGCPSPTTVTIRADVTDASSLAWVRLYYQPPGGSWTYATMSHESGNTYMATIGPFSQAGTLYYYVKAQDNAVNEAQSSTYTITVNDCDTTAPTITNIRESDDPINKQGCPSPTTVTIRADVSDASGLDWVRLYYQPPGGSWTYTTMSHESGNTYKATIGSFSQAGILNYYVKARDNASNEAQSSTYTVTVNDCLPTGCTTVEKVTVCADTFSLEPDGKFRATGNVKLGDYVGVSEDGYVLIDQATPSVTGLGSVIFIPVSLELFAGRFWAEVQTGLVVPDPSAEISQFLTEQANLLLDEGSVTLEVDLLEGRISGEGEVHIEFDENSLDTQASFSIDIYGNVSGDVAYLNLLVASCTVEITGAHIDNSGIFISEAKLTLPSSLGRSWGWVRDVRITSDEITFGNGYAEINLPNIVVGADGGFRIEGVHATLIVDSSGYYRFDGSGALVIPNLYPGQECYIWVQIDLRSTGLREAELKLTGCFRIPLGATGFYLSGIYGRVQFNASSTVVEITAYVESMSVPRVGPLVKGNATVRIDTAGELGIFGTVQVLSYAAADASLTISQHDGLRGSVYVRAGIVEGSAELHIWKASGKFHFTGRGMVKIRVEKGQIFSRCPLGVCIYIPPSDMDFLSIEVEIGEFCTSSGCDDTVYGIKGTVSFMGYSAGFYVDAEGSIHFGSDLDEYRLVDQASAGPHLTGYTSQGTTDFIDVPIDTEAESVFFALAWERGTPGLSVITPDGVEITPASAASDPDVYYDQTGQQALFNIANPMQGTWQVKVSNLTGDENYTMAALGSNVPPSIEVTAPSEFNEAGSLAYTIRWMAFDPDDEATIALYYDDNDAGNNGTLIVSGLSETDSVGEHVWNTSEIPSGTYYIYALADDLRNAPVVAYSAGTVQIQDTTSPAVPTGLIASAGDGYIALEWQADSEDDLGGYKVYYGTSSRTYSQVLDIGNVAKTQLQGLIAGQTYYAAVTAYDVSGNESAYSPEVSATATYGPRLLLGPGWNLIALPFTPPNPDIAVALSPFSGTYEEVWTYEGCDTSDHWKSYNPNLPAPLNDLQVLDERKGYWIHVGPGGGSLGLSGSPPSIVNIQLCQGWNLMAYPSREPQRLPDALASIEDKYTEVWTFRAWDTEDHWKSYNPNLPTPLNDLKELGPGWGYWIHVTEDTVLMITN